MHWFWLNIPLAAAFFAIWTGVPLWLVLKHPDTGSGPGVLATSPRYASSSRALAGAPGNRATR
jgi:hypothetical protein